MSNYHTLNKIDLLEDRNTFSMRLHGRFYFDLFQSYNFLNDCLIISKVNMSEYSPR